MTELLVVFVTWIGTGSDPYWVKRPLAPELGMAREIVEKLLGETHQLRLPTGGIGRVHMNCTYTDYWVDYDETGKAVYIIFKKTGETKLVRVSATPPLPPKCVTVIQPVEVAPLPRLLVRVKHQPEPKPFPMLQTPMFRTPSAKATELRQSLDGGLKYLDLLATCRAVMQSIVPTWRESIGRLRTEEKKVQGAILRDWLSYTEKMHPNLKEGTDYIQPIPIPIRP